MEHILEQYKEEPAAVIQALQDTQRAYGCISQEHLKQISEVVGAPYSYTYAIATFYKSFALQKRGTYVIKVCDGTACHLKLSEDMMEEIRNYLGIELEETTEDGLFTLEQVNCLGACAMAPVVSINERLYGTLTRKAIRGIIDHLRTQQAAAPESSPAVPPAESLPEAVRKTLAAHTETESMGARILRRIKSLLDTLSSKIEQMLEEP